MVEVKKDGIKIRHFACKDRNGRIDINQLIYCRGTFRDDETWLKPGNIETTQKSLQECYYRFKLNELVKKSKNWDGKVKCSKCKACES